MNQGVIGLNVRREHDPDARTGDFSTHADASTAVVREVQGLFGCEWLEYFKLVCSSGVLILGFRVLPQYFFGA